MYADRKDNTGQCKYADREENLCWAMYEIAKKIIIIIIVIMYADCKENTGQCNSAKITKNYCRLRFTSNGRECVRVSIVL